MKKTSVIILNFLLACALPGASFAFAKTPEPNFSNVFEKKISVFEPKETISYSRELGVGEPKILPGSFQYFFLEFWRNISAFLAFDSGKKAEQLFSQANSRLYELRKLTEKKSFSSKILEHALKEYLRDIEAGKIALEKLKDEKTKSERIKKYSAGEFARQRIFEDLKNYYSKELIEKYQKKSMESYARVVFSQGVEKTREILKQYVDSNIRFDQKSIKDVKFFDAIKEKFNEPEIQEMLEDVQKYAIQKIQENLNYLNSGDFSRGLRKSLGTVSTGTPSTLNEIIEEIIQEKKRLEEDVGQKRGN